MDDRYFAMRQRLGALPPGPWVVTQRASPGWRVETEDGRAVAFGPEPPSRSPAAHLLKECVDHLPALFAELDELRERTRVAEARVDEQFGHLTRLRNALEDVLEGMREHEIPDWFQGRLQEALDYHKVETGL